MAIRVGKDSVWQQFKRQVAALDKSYVKVGVMADKSGEGMVTIAMAHELGVPGKLPERSFIRKTFEDKEEELGHQIAKLARAYLANKISLDKALDLLGLWASTQVKKTITEERVVPRIDPEGPTAKRKGSTVTLVDEGQLLQSITWAVVQ